MHCSIKGNGFAFWQLSMRFGGARVKIGARADLAGRPAWASSKGTTSCSKTVLKKSCTPQHNSTSPAAAARLLFSKFCQPEALVTVKLCSLFSESCFKLLTRRVFLAAVLYVYASAFLCFPRWKLQKYRLTFPGASDIPSDSLFFLKKPLLSCSFSSLVPEMHSGLSVTFGKLCLFVCFFLQLHFKKAPFNLSLNILTTRVSSSEITSMHFHLNVTLPRFLACNCHSKPKPQSQ